MQLKRSQPYAPLHVASSCWVPNIMLDCRDVDEAEAKLKAERVTKAEIKAASTTTGAGALPHRVRLCAPQHDSVNSCKN